MSLEPTADGRPCRPEVIVEDDRTGMTLEVLKRAFLDNLYYLQGVNEKTATRHDRYMALACTIRDRLIHRWIKSQETYLEVDAKTVNYLSAEFLLGRYTSNNILNVELEEILPEAMAELGIDLDDILDVEPDAGLGNGGLGRLAACFLDSMATLRLPAFGYGIRYEFGIFEQEIRDGQQVERPDQWLRFGNPWEIARPEHCVPVHFGGTTAWEDDEHGRARKRWSWQRTVLGLPYDTPIDGYDNDNSNTLRLWCARSTREFDLDEFNQGDYMRAIEEKAMAENISKVLYPNDNSAQGKELRLRQQYFFVACSLHDIVRRYQARHQTFDAFPDKVAIQMNDTHPSIAVPELMRLLVDRHRLAWERAWDITVRTLAYTNHTLMAEALESWPVELLERLLPRHLEIVYEINRRFLEEVKRRWPGDAARVQRMSIIAESPRKAVRMGWLAVVGSHSVNGVAALHTELLKENLFHDFYEMWPERFNNKTNGVTPRRWLLLANPRLAKEITHRVGPAWPRDLDRLAQLAPLADDPEFRSRFRGIKQANKIDLAARIEAETGIEVDASSLFDVQVKRLHEYKRQHLNALHIIARYLRVLREPDREVVPRTFIFAGKAAPGYFLAKLIIRFICAIGERINHDPAVRGRYRVVFLPNYRVSLAEKIFPGADLSEQISTAGTEASGTGNMKFAMNGALTIGTLDGANIEIRDAVGGDNFFLFGLRAEEVEAAKRNGYVPMDAVRRSPELAAVIDFVASGALSPDQPDRFRPLIDNLLGGDPYMVLRDFDDYVRCQDEVERVYRDPDEWSRRALLNVANMGRFSSDRTIEEYARDIWGVEAVPVRLG
jgi:starch phosphorylase